MHIKIRKEKPSDIRAVFELIQRAFENEQQSNHQEQILVENLRRSPEFIPQLSIIAEIEGKIVGVPSCIGSCGCAASVYAIKLPFNAPDENCLVKELFENSLKGIHGMVRYPKEFGIIS